MHDFDEFKWIEASFIKGVEVDTTFWLGRNTEEEYLKVINDLCEIHRLIESGASAETIEEKHPELKDALYIFFGAHPVEVSFYKESGYWFTFDGRHRIYVASKYGREIPCIVQDGKKRDEFTEEFAALIKDRFLPKESIFKRLIRSILRR